MEFSFRPYQNDDLQEVYKIYSYYIENSTATCQISPITLEQMRRIVEPDNPVYKTFVVVSGEEIGGYVLFTRFKEREAYDRTAEVTIYLKEGFTGKGIGTEALRLIEDVAQKAGMHLLVSLVSSDNESSIRLFEKNGYAKCAEFHESSYKFGHYFGLVCFEKMLPNK